MSIQKYLHECTQKSNPTQGANKVKVIMYGIERGEYSMGGFAENQH